MARFRRTFPGCSDRIVAICVYASRRRHNGQITGPPCPLHQARRWWIRCADDRNTVKNRRADSRSYNSLLLFVPEDEDLWESWLLPSRTQFYFLHSQGLLRRGIPPKSSFQTGNEVGDACFSYRLARQE